MNVALILSRKYPNALWALNGDSYDGLDWRDAAPKPTEAELADLWSTVQAEIEAEAQARLERKQSAIAKLEALGLTMDEVSAAFGIEAQA